MPGPVATEGRLQQLAWPHKPLDRRGLDNHRTGQAAGRPAGEIAEKSWRHQLIERLGKSTPEGLAKFEESLKNVSTTTTSQSRGIGAEEPVSYTHLTLPTNA